ncbi:hypothetical protein COBT_000296 [Conglomerata obtusa]
MQNFIKEIEHALTLEDPITQTTYHKQILKEIDPFQPLCVSEPFPLFLKTSFEMFIDDDYFDKCTRILINNSSKLNLTEFSCVISDLLLNPRYKTEARELVHEMNSSVPEVRKRRKVSFNEVPNILYIEKEIDDVGEGRNHVTGDRIRKERLAGVREVAKHKKPLRLDNVLRVKKSTESEKQRRREFENISFVNENVNAKFEVTEIKEVFAEKVKCIDLPLINLSPVNVWKSIDFVKVIENKCFNIHAILDDPKILDEFL